MSHAELAGGPFTEACAANDPVEGVSDANEALKLRHAIGLGEASHSPTYWLRSPQ
jgi:hypothetical protein